MTGYLVVAAYLVVGMFTSMAVARRTDERDVDSFMAGMVVLLWPLAWLFAFVAMVGALAVSVRRPGGDETP